VARLPHSDALPTSDQSYEISTDFSLPFCLRYSRRAKHLRLVVKPGGIELVVPPAISEAQALAFLHRHRAWAECKLSELRGRVVDRPPPQSLETGGTVPFRGREVPLVISEVPGRRIRVDFDECFVISLPSGSPVQTRQRVRAALFAWVKAWLQGEAGRLAALHAERFGLQPRQIRVKQMKSRWGSCGPRNDINLNWLLAFAPPSVLEYVVVHELCHIRHRDHSARFWELVTRHLPGYLQERQWLKRNGAELLRRFG
jgi:predicted metal-dependent hydrolase